MRTKVSHEFVEAIPEKLQEGVVYVSITYALAAHLCCCGCGHEVHTPLHPRQWSLTFDGETITLWPSIGNWSFPCRSHYWVKANRVRWSYEMSDWRIAQLRAKQAEQLRRHYGEPEPAKDIWDQAQPTDVGLEFVPGDDGSSDAEHGLVESNAFEVATRGQSSRRTTPAWWAAPRAIAPPTPDGPLSGPMG